MKNFRVRKSIIIPVGGILLLLSLWTLFFRKDTGPERTWVNPQVGTFMVGVTASGELRAPNSTLVMGPRGVRNARIWQLQIIDMVAEGTEVSEGDYVAQLDLTDLHTRLQSAEVAYERVLSQYEQAELDSSLTLTQARYDIENLELQLEERELAVEQSIFESPAVQRRTQIELERTQRQLDQSRVNYVTRQKQAEARLREIEAELASERNLLERLRELERDFTIRAPMDGMIIYYRDRRGRRTTVGSSINVQNPIIAEIPDFELMESVTFINEVDIRQIEEGQFVELGLDADRDKRLTGVVTSVANIGEQRSGTDARVFEVVVRVNESDPDLRPTMTSMNRIHVESIPQAMFVPLEAIHTVDEHQFVYKQSGTGIVLQQVALGAMNETQVVIEEGLERTDRVLVSAPPVAEGIRRYWLAGEPSEPLADGS